MSPGAEMLDDTFKQKSTLGIPAGASSKHNMLGLATAADADGGSYVAFSLT